MSETITLRLHVSDLHTRATFGVAEELAVPILLATILIVSFIKSIIQAEKKIGPQHSPTVSILKVHEAKVEDENNALHI